MIYEIFPSLVYQCNLSEDIKDIDFSHFETKEGFSKDTYVLDNNTSLTLKNLILNHINIYTKDILEISKNLEFYITRSWITHIKEGENIPSLHNHENSFFTGVFYFNVEENVDSIIFTKTRFHQYLNYYFEKNNKFNQGDVIFHPKKYDLIIFDASILHQMGPIVTNKVRNSLAFEVFARGIFGKKNIGAMYNLGELTLK